MIAILAKGRPPMKITTFQQNVTSYVDQIEEEMRRIGMWQAEALRPEQLEFRKAFAMDTMSFSQWLQFIFLGRVREAVRTNNLPGSSSVGAQAAREFDGYPEANRLVRLLSEFDALFE